MTYDDITLGQWMEMEEAAKEFDNEYYQAAARISILSGIDFDKLISMPLYHYGKIQKKYDFLTSRPKTIMATEFEGFPIRLDFKKLPFGDFVDVMEICKSKPDRYDLIIAKFWDSGMPLEEAAKVIRDKMKIGLALGLSAFFFDYWQRLQPLILQSLTKQRRKMERELGVRMGFWDRIRGLFGLTGYRIATLFGGSRSSK